MPQLNMPQLTKGWLESQAAFEARKAAAEKAEAEKAAEFEKSVKNGTVGRIANDPEEQKRAAKYREQVRAEYRKNTAVRTKVLSAAEAKKQQAEKDQLAKLEKARQERHVAKAGSAAVLFSSNPNSEQVWTIAKTDAKGKKAKQDAENLRTEVMRDYKQVEAEAVLGKAPARISMWKPQRRQPVDAATQTLEQTRPLRNV